MSKDPKKALRLIKQARYLYHQYQITSKLPAFKYEIVEIYLSAVIFEQQGLLTVDKILNFQNRIDEISEMKNIDGKYQLRIQPDYIE